MKIVNYISLVNPDKCVGDRLCQGACPTSAIKVVKKKAAVDEERCVACRKCVEVCREKAVSMAPRAEPLTLMMNTETVDQTDIAELCARARCSPDQLYCACTGTLAKEVAAAILAGATSPEDVVLMTGAGSGCGIYCMGAIFVMFRAAGVRIPEDPRWHPLPLSVWDIPKHVAERHPMHRILEDRAAFSTKS
jgi:NAD-dependent dihydropyrimidine dehydrogenase PreA subunit/bacterioferritin-associated ferredoxin